MELSFPSVSGLLLFVACGDPALAALASKVDTPGAQVAEVARDPATAGRLLVDIMNEPDNFSLRCAPLDTGFEGVPHNLAQKTCMSQHARILLPPVLAGQRFPGVSLCTCSRPPT